MKVSFNFVIAIDGVAAAGKGTLSSALAKHYEEYGCKLLPTGNLYRALAQRVLQDKLNISDKRVIEDVIKGLYKANLSDSTLHSAEISDIASQIASIGYVRIAMNKLQRDWISNQRICVVEGRDIGTTICPHAQVKIFLTATLEERAARRKSDLDKITANTMSYNEVLEKLKSRDFQDSNRENSPLKITNDYSIIDSTNISPQQVLDKAIDIVEKEIDKSPLKV